MEASVTTEHPPEATDTARAPELPHGSTDVPVFYDADAKAAERAKRGFKINGVIYVPRRKTGALVEEVLKLGQEAPDTEFEKDDEGKILRDGEGNPIEKDLPFEEQVAGIRRLYRQVSMLLADSQDGNPDPEALRNALDIEDARAMIAPLMGNSDEDKADPPKGGDAPQS
jgi:hypothetical protein